MQQTYKLNSSFNNLTLKTRQVTKIKVTPTMSDDRPILVTGAAGYIATHVVQQLQQLGYRVRGTVRSTKQEDKIRAIKQLCPDASYPIELLEADLTKDDGWRVAVSGCQYVIHTASPVPAENPRDENDLIVPAVNGTLSVLKACREDGGVKRVVLTSSLAAVATGAVTGSYSEEDWTDVNKTKLAYYKSKTLAEKAAWDFIAGLPDDEKFELAVVNPGYVVGPVLCGGWATSMTIPTRLLLKQIPALGRIMMPVVDVRDVAAMHVNAMTIPEAAGNRHIAVAKCLWLKEMAVIYDNEFKELGYKVPKGVAPLFAVKMMAVFDKALKLILPTWGKVLNYDNTRMRTVLNVEPRDMKDSFLEMAYTMIEKGLIKKTKKYKEKKG